MSSHEVAEAVFRTNRRSNRIDASARWDKTDRMDYFDKPAIVAEIPGRAHPAPHEQQDRPAPSSLLFSNVINADS